jgi:hypothetical protein
VRKYNENFLFEVHISNITFCARLTLLLRKVSRGEFC